MNLNISQSDVQKILEKSEGWVSGAKLIGLKLMGKSEEESHFQKDWQFLKQLEIYL